MLFITGGLPFTGNLMKGEKYICVSDKKTFAIKWKNAVLLLHAKKEKQGSWLFALLSAV